MAHNPNMYYDKSKLEDSEGEEYPNSAPPDAVVRTYGVYNTGTRINFRVHDGGSKSPVIYYVNNSTFTPGTPDVQVRQGDEKSGPIVAFGKFHNLSGHVTLGIGAPDGQPAPIFEELKKESRLTHSEYVFETNFTPDGQRHKYIWRRTIGKGLFANYACLDSGTGQLVAYFAKTGAKSAKKVGRLCLTAQTRPELDRLLLVSWFAMREKENRNAWYVGGFISAAT